MDSGETLESHAELVSTNLFGLPDEDVGYAPSVCTDFSEFYMIAHGTRLEKCLTITVQRQWFNQLGRIWQRRQSSSLGKAVFGISF